MDDKLFELLDDLSIKDTKLLLDKDIDLSIDSSTRKRIEKSVMEKTGYHNKNSVNLGKNNKILGGIIMKRKIALALGACMILGLSGGTYAYAKTPVAYVSMDINPSVELGVNAFDKVVSVEAYNEDGKKILNDTDLKNYNIKNAISTLLAHAISEGYIKEDGTSSVEITTSTDKEKVADKLDDSLKETADKTLTDNDVKAEIETDNVALARRDEARELGITPGKLNLIQKLQALDPTINVEDYKNSSVKEIQKKAKELRKANKADGANTENNTTSTDSNTNSDAAVQQNSTDANNEDSKENKNNNGNNGNGNGNGKKEENSDIDKGNSNKDNAAEKQNNGHNENSKANNNSVKSEDDDNSKAKGNGNASKSEHSDNGNSNSQNKGKNK